MSRAQTSANLPKLAQAALDRPWVLLAGLLALTTLVNITALGNEFYWDDRHQILEGRLTRSWSSIPEIFTSEVWRNVKTEDYPLTAPVFVYLPARRLPKLAREFLIYTRSAAAQLVIRRAGFVDQQPEEIPIDAQGDRMANAIQGAGPEIGLEALQAMLERLRGMKRMTTSFRFETGSVQLDAQSRSNVEQLAYALESGVYDGRALLFAGFSDGEGPAATGVTAC